MNTTCTRKLEFDAAHRVLGHGGKCKNLHGHRYVAEVSATASNLNDLDMVIDFSVLKSVVGGWVDQYWDHNIILNSKDPLLMCGPEAFSGGSEGCKVPFVMPEGLNPTAETLAQFLFDKATELLKDEGVAVTHIRLYETPNCWADYPVQSV